MSGPIRVLIADDHPVVRDGLRAMLATQPDMELVGEATTGTERPLGAEVEAALLRVAQEALANVRKHAAASQVTLTLSYLDDLVMLDVADDGVGFDPATTRAAGGGLGLRAMQERATQLGGHLTIESAPGEGTTIAVELPTVMPGTEMR